MLLGQSVIDKDYWFRSSLSNPSILSSVTCLKQRDLEDRHLPQQDRWPECCAYRLADSPFVVSVYSSRHRACRWRTKLLSSASLGCYSQNAVHAWFRKAAGSKAAAVVEQENEVLRCGAATSCSVEPTCSNYSCRNYFLCPSHPPLVVLHSPFPKLPCDTRKWDIANLDS